jgi:hypothetical protein
LPTPLSAWIGTVGYGRVLFVAPIVNRLCDAEGPILLAPQADQGATGVTIVAPV